MEGMLEGFTSYEEMFDIFHWASLIFMLAALIIIAVGKKIYDLIAPFSVDEELGTHDNKALATSYLGYLVGQAVIVWGVMTGPSAGDWVKDLIMVGVWSVIGILLLNLARLVNDKFILHGFSNRKEIITDRNVGVGAVQAGSFIGTALLLQAIVSGDQPDFISGLIGALVFFILGQITFVLFARIYEKLVGYDLHKALEEDNPAAGVSFGLTLFAVGVILSKTVATTMSIPTFFAWFINGLVLILFARYLVDKFILPGHDLVQEIDRDQNWGVALVEGGSAVMIAFLLNASFA